MSKVGGPGPHSSKSGWATGTHGPQGSAPDPPPPPLRGRRYRMRVPKISGKGVLFVRQSPAREL